MLAVFFADISAAPAEAGGLPLSDYRLEKLKTLRGEAQRRRSVGAELLLAAALETCGQTLTPPLPICADADGKPQLCGGELCFNLSHSGDYAACAVSSAPVGVDIQRVETQKEQLARRVFRPEELRMIESSTDRDDCFTMLWALKESYLKYLGTGLRRGMNSFAVCIDGGGHAHVAGDDRCRLRHWAENGYQIAVCTDAQCGEAELKEIKLNIMRF